MRIGLIAFSAFSLITCGAAFAAGPAATQPTTSCVTVNFTGEVVETPCLVSVGNANSVDLGQIKKVAGKKGRITPVPFYLTDCKGDVNAVCVTWDGATTGTLEGGKLTTNIKNVSMSFYKDSHATSGSEVKAREVIDLHIDATTKGTDGVNRNYLSIPLYARLETDDTKEPESVGTVSSSVIFKVQFK